jgi:hypothetical protein
MEEQAGTASDSKTSRRHFLDVLLSASLLGWLASVAYPVIRYLKPLPHFCCPQWRALSHPYWQ